MWRASMTWITLISFSIIQFLLEYELGPLKELIVIILKKGGGDPNFNWVINKVARTWNECGPCFS